MITSGMEILLVQAFVILRFGFSDLVLPVYVAIKLPKQRDCSSAKLGSDFAEGF